MSDRIIRRARTGDVRAIHRIVSGYVDRGVLLGKQLVTLYEDVQDFLVAELDGQVVGCGALHVMWEDLAEVRTVAVDPAVVAAALATRWSPSWSQRPASWVCGGCSCSRSSTSSSRRHGFREIEGTPVQAEVYAELRRSYDEGVAEFLDLPRVKPNTLGNTRMLLELGKRCQAPLIRRGRPIRPRP